jgi:Ca2+-binding RTX toxin-like protein
MPVSIPFQVGFTGFGGGSTGDTFFTVLSLYGAPGPDSIRVNWGGAEFFGAAPQVVTYEPQPEDGSFNMPGPGLSRAYADGEYIIKASTTLGFEKITVTLSLFADANNSFGVAKTGDGRANMMAGGSGGDNFSGMNGDDWLGGGGGDDSLSGGKGNDFLGGSDGNDTADGGAGDDALFGDDGNDSLSGLSGNDYMGGGNGADAMHGGAGNDRMWGDNGAFGDPLGDLGNDTLFGGVGDDEMDGEGGDDSLSGGSGLDSLTGGDGDDSMAGGVDGDWLFGYAGEDRLNGGSGSDTMNGGLGRDLIITQADGELDQIVYGAASEGQDRIAGFEHGIDKISFFFLGPVDSDHFIAPDGVMSDDQAYIIYDSATGRLSVDLDGMDSGAALLVATFTDLATVTLEDFWFALPI